MKSSRFGALLCLFLAWPLTTAFGQYLPPNGTESYNSYLSPSLLSGGPSVTSQDSPQADSINPASAAMKQRVTLDASYLALVGIQGGGGWNGSIANLGVTIPTKVGVFTSSGHFMTSALPEVALGTVGELSGSFAKELFPGLLVGAGLHVLAGANGGSSLAWGLNGDLGFLSSPGDIGFMKNFRWGGVLQGIGKGFRPVAGASAYPPPFTPVAGAAFDLLDGRNLTVGFSGDVGFPEFQDVNVRLGAKITLFKKLSLTVSDGADFQDLLNAGSRPTRSFIPSVGLSYSFRTSLGSSSRFLSEHGWNRTDLKTQVAAAPLQGGVWAFAAGVNAPLGVVDRTPPKIVVDYPSPVWISPNNDGIQDFVQFPIQISDNRYVEGYKFDVFNDEGTLVRQIENAKQIPKKRDFHNAVSQLLSVKSGIPIPATLRWNGLNDKGARVADGLYRFTIQAWDDSGNTATTREYVVHVKDALPSVTVKQLSGNQLIFAPESASTKPTISIVQSGSVEGLWTGEITNSSEKVVRTFTWKDSAPKPFTWDGKTNAGNLAPNGVYNYRITGTDRAGNTSSASLDNIVIDTTPTPVSLKIEYSYFSPNGDGVKDVERLTPEVPVQKGLTDWSLTITDSSGQIVRAFSGTTSMPKSLVFDGRSNDGTPLAQATYFAHLYLTYANGNHPSAQSPPITIDTTPPQASVTENHTIFSPVGNGSKSTITFYQDTTAAESWKGVIDNTQGAPVKTFSWVGTASSRVVWNGHSDNGLVVPDGTYTYRIQGTDRAGNVGTSNPVSFQVNTKNTPIFVSVEYPAFSPNGPRNKIKIFPQVLATDVVQSYHLDIVNAGQKVVRSFSGVKSVPPSVTWEGFTDSGKPAPDGKYVAVLHVLYANGNSRQADSPSFLLDTKYPQITAKANWTVFDPSAGSHRKTVTITNNSSSEPLWEADILDSTGSVVKREFWKGTAGTFVWNGTDMQGNVVPNGSYTYRILATNVAGNTSRAVIRNIRVDARPTPIYITASRQGFSPVGTANNNTITFNTYATQADGVSHWTLRVLNSSGAVVRSYSGGSTLPASVTWDGKNDSGTVSPDGAYVAEFQVSYLKGTEPTAKTSSFVLDTKFPQVTAKADWVLFDPAAGSHRQTVTITNTTSKGPVWKASILDSADNVVRSQTWKGEAGTFVWDGTDSQGKTVPDGTYSYQISATNIAGNTTRAVIPNIVVDTRPTPVRITASTAGFAPTGNGVDDTITFDTGAAQTDGVSHWVLQIIDANGLVVRSYTGGPHLASSVTWDGTNDTGTVSPDGSYHARFQVVYLKGTEPTAQTSPFVLDSAGPTVHVTIGPLPFAPDNTGPNTILTFKIGVTDLAKVATWKIDIYDPKNNLFKTYAGNGMPPAEIQWDGKSDSGELVSSAETYPYRMTVGDVYGNSTTVGGTIPVDVLVTRQGDQLRIRIASIIFAPNSASLDTSSQGTQEGNSKILDRLAQILKKYGTYKIRIEGYAVSVYWNDPAKSKLEQQQVLIPLSLARAETVRQALIKRGITAARMTAVGLGDENPVVPNSDLKDRWKNRRVEFILVR